MWLFGFVHQHQISMIRNELLQVFCEKPEFCNFQPNFETSLSGQSCWEIMYFLQIKRTATSLWWTVFGQQEIYPPCQPLFSQTSVLLSLLLIAQIFLRDMMMMLPECPGRPKIIRKVACGSASGSVLSPIHESAVGHLKRISKRGGCEMVFALHSVMWTSCHTAGPDNMNTIIIRRYCPLVNNLEL